MEVKGHLLALRNPRSLTDLGIKVANTELFFLLDSIIYEISFRTELLSQTLIAHQSLLPDACFRVILLGTINEQLTSLYFCLCLSRYILITRYI